MPALSILIWLPALCGVLGAVFTGARRRVQNDERPSTESSAERRLAEGHDVLLLGHFHEPRVWPVAGGEVRLLDAWFRSREVEWLR